MISCDKNMTHENALNSYFRIYAESVDILSIQFEKNRFNKKRPIDVMSLKNFKLNRN